MATIVVAALPIAVVWGARMRHVISSPWLCAGLTIALSLIASGAGNWYWKRRPGSGDVLFSELLLWGWLRRVHVERQLDDATNRLGEADRATGPHAGGATDGHKVNADRRLALLTEIASALDAQDAYVDGHSRRVARHTRTVARKLGLPAEEVAKVVRAAAMHDVGKLRVPREVLMKPSALTDAEFEVIKRHSTVGAEMVSCLGDPELTAIVRHHHERLDGSGYPAGLRGTEIPLGARIIAVADTFDAITSARPYRPAARHKQAIDVLVEEAGTQLDPEAVRAFVSYYSGRRLLVLWAILGAIPQRAVEWTRRIGGLPRSGSPVPTAASAAAIMAMGALAIIPPFGFRNLMDHPAWHSEAPRAQLAAARPAARSVGRRAGFQHHPHRGALAVRPRWRTAAGRGLRLKLRTLAGSRRVASASAGVPATAPSIPHGSGVSAGSGGNRGGKGFPARPSPRPRGRTVSGSGGGGSGGPSSGSGRGSTGRSGTGSGAAGGSGSATTSAPTAGTTASPGGGTMPTPDAGGSGGTAGGSGGTAGAGSGGTTGGSAGGGAGGSAGGSVGVGAGGSAGGGAGGTTGGSVGGGAGGSAGGGAGGTTGGSAGGSAGGGAGGSAGGGAPGSAGGGAGGS
ncbi:MAG: HD-GYP domain-containing protein, partial [Solirubrobacteraceae bacterium]